ncbi:BcsR/BcsP family cellulose biosynthesis protein [Chromobacterium vaccinii]|uniref:BcsR/BcsP family cellulose biosynthesis protein n=1 Tax=Chromobacterium vaccinii TaxID=1108595 RepID=UPI003C78D914
MHKDTSRLRIHLQCPDFHYQEIGQDAAVIEVCERWPLLKAIYCGAGPAQGDEAAYEREVASDTA